MNLKSVTEITSPKGKKYLEKLRGRGNLVLLVGSGVSMWSPSNLPNGQKVTEDIANLIANLTVSSKTTVIESVKSSAFEHIMERYPKPSVLKEVIANAYRPTPPNAVHEAIADLLNAGIVEHVITTNYDEGIENACKAICHVTRRPLEIIYESDVTRIISNQPILFKIHGCAKPGREDSIISTLSTEGELPEWKRKLLERLTQDKILLISGYSGSDFEISPELVNLSIKRLIWNSFENPRINSEAMTPNAYHVVKETNGRALVGSMHDMFGALNQKVCSFNRPSLTPSFIGELEGRLTSWELDKWRAWVLNGLSCAKDGIAVAERMFRNSGSSEEMKLESLLAIAEAYFHSGFYKKAIKSYSEAGALARKNNNLEDWVKAELGIIESKRVAGYWLQASSRIKKLSKQVKMFFAGKELKKVESQIALKRVLLQRYIFRLFSLFRISFFTRYVQNSAKNNLSIVSAYSAKNGKWFDLRQCQMLAKKFDIPFSVIYTGKMKTTTFRYGYRQLGYLLAEMMAIRSEMLDGAISDVSVIYPYLNKAEELGIYPEYWKLVKTARRTFGDSEIPQDIKDKEKVAWKKCEYTLTMKLLLRFFGENA